MIPILPVIKGFKRGWTETIYEGQCPKGFPADIMTVARRKLAMVNAAIRLSDLRVPPRNMLEALKGDRKGQHSIRINDQFRVCFSWVGDGAEDVEICDYH